MTKTMTVAERNEGIVQMRRNGCSAKFIARTYNMSLATVYNVLKLHPGLSDRRRGSSPKTADRDREIIRRYKDGESLREIARAYGITHQRVDEILRRAGVSKRPPGNAHPTPDLDLAVFLYNAGEPLAVIAKVAGYASASTVSDALRLRGIPPMRKKSLTPGSRAA